MPGCVSSSSEAAFAIKELKVLVMPGGCEASYNNG